MAKNRMVDTIFWEDAYTANLDPIEKLLFLYFLTNSSATICGIYQITLKKIAVETGIDREMVEKILERFSDDKKIFYAEGWLGIKNFIKHQNQKSPKIQAGIENELINIPKMIRSLVFGKGMDTLSHLNLNLNLNSNSNTTQNSAVAETLPFEDFFKIYPKKTEKKKAKALWGKIKTEIQKRIMSDVEERKKGKQWLAGFIPYPTTYLRGERWNDEIEMEKVIEFKQIDLTKQNVNSLS